MGAEFLNITKGYFFQKRMLDEHSNLHISNDELVKIQQKDPVQIDFLKNAINIIDNRQEATILCQSKVKNPNFFSIIHSNAVFQDLFDVSNSEVLGKSYDFLFEEFNLDYSSEDQIEYFRLIKDVKDFHPCSIVVNLNDRTNIKSREKYKIDFEPDTFVDDLGRRHASFTFQPVSKVTQEIKKKETEEAEYREKNDREISRRKSESLLKGMERSLRNERLLRQISSVIISDLPIDRISKEIAKSICQHFRVDRCIIHDFRDSETNFVVEYCDKNVNNMLDSNNPKKIKLLTKYINFQNNFYKRRATESDKSWVSIAENIADDSNFESIRSICEDFRIGSQVSITSVFNGRVNGGVYIHQSQSRAWLADEIEVIEMIADQISIAFDRSVSVEKVMISNHELMEKTIELRNALKKEQEMRKMQNEFVALVSHEFKTPLQIIDGTRELLYRKIKSLGDNEETIEKSFERIKSGITRMNGLINSTLNLAKMESNDGKINVDKNDFDIAKFINEIIEKNSNLAQNRNIKFLVNVKDLPAVFNGDIKLLEHSFNNVISNAIKYSKNDSAIKVLAKSNDKKIAVRVIDSGIGIPKDDIQNIGKKFYRAKNTLSVAGTGIGLYLSKHFIELHGGSLDINSEVNVGTSITITLPRY